MEEKQRNWRQILPIVMFAYHTSYHQAIKTTPFEAMFARKARMPQDLEHYARPRICKTGVAERIEAYMEDIRKIQEEVSKNNSEAQRKNKQRFDKKAKEKAFQPGDMVMLRIHRKKKGKRSKLADRFSGPWEVMAQVSVVNYVI